MCRHAASHAVDDHTPTERQQGTRREAGARHREGLARAMTTLRNPRVRAARLGHMVRRLVALHAETTASDLAAGLAWYERAQAAARAMAVDGQVDRAAAVIAHLSPREQWATNVANAARVLSAAADGEDTCPPVHTYGQRAKAWAVATGAAAPDANHGPKTGAFYRNIMGDTGAVCVDIHAARAAEGKTGDIRNPDGARYALIAEAYVRAAAIVGMTPRDLQAAVWVHVRGAAD